MLDFQDLYDSYATDVYRFARWLAGDRFEAEDITSETLVRAWVRRSTIRTKTLKAYLFAIARNVYLERRRTDKRQVTLDHGHPDPAPGPDKLVESQLELQRVQRVLQTLPEIDRAAFVLRVQHELPYAEIARVLQVSLATARAYAEIARVLQVSLATARVKVHRVRKKLLAIRVEWEACQ
jgi:RNA polymerase sigma-70 factor (ECF subfamily)